MPFKLEPNLLKLSHSNNIDEAIGEWKRFKQDKVHTEKVCICNRKIKNINYMYNPITKKFIITGGKCYSHINSYWKDKGLDIPNVDEKFKEFINKFFEKGEYEYIEDLSKYSKQIENHIINHYTKYVDTEIEINILQEMKKLLSVNNMECLKPLYFRLCEIYIYRKTYDKILKQMKSNYRIINHYTKYVDTEIEINILQEMKKLLSVNNMECLKPLYFRLCEIYIYRKTYDKILKQMKSNYRKEYKKVCKNLPMFLTRFADNPDLKYKLNCNRCLENSDRVYLKAYEGYDFYACNRCGNLIDYWLKRGNGINAFHY